MNHEGLFKFLVKALVPHPFISSAQDKTATWPLSLQSAHHNYTRNNDSIVIWACGIVDDLDGQQCDDSLTSICASRDLASHHTAAKGLKDEINSDVVTLKYAA